MVTDSYLAVVAALGLETSLGYTVRKKRSGRVACIGEQRNGQRILIGNQKERDHSEEAGDSIKTDRKEISLEGVKLDFSGS